MMVRPLKRKPLAMEQGELDLASGMLPRDFHEMRELEVDQVDLKVQTKALQDLLASLKKLGSPKKPPADRVLAAQLADAIMKTSAIDLVALKGVLETSVAEVRLRLDASVEQRRERLHLAAREAGMVQKRFGDYDRVGPFKVSYRGKVVILEVGSERCGEIEATDGDQVLAAIKEQLAQLDASELKREEFFRVLKDSWRLVREHKKDVDGWAPIRTLYPYIVAMKSLQSEEFMKKPGARSIRDYSSAQFVYDLARFGRRGWGCGDEILRSQTPNMATVASGKCMTLPNLDEMDKLGEQIARIRIEKGAAGGTERGAG